MTDPDADCPSGDGRGGGGRGGGGSGRGGGGGSSSEGSPSALSDVAGERGGCGGGGGRRLPGSEDDFVEVADEEDDSGVEGRDSGGGGGAGKGGAAVVSAVAAAGALLTPDCHARLGRQLMVSCSDGQLVTVVALLALGVDPNYVKSHEDATGVYEWTGLRAAYTHLDPRHICDQDFCLAMLLAAGADPWRQLADGWVCANEMANSKQAASFCEFLCNRERNNTPMRLPPDSDMVHPMIEAANVGKWILLAQMLASGNPPDVEYRDSHGQCWTPLRAAFEADANFGRERILSVMCLLACRADPNQVHEPDGWCLRENAKAERDPEVLKIIKLMDELRDPQHAWRNGTLDDDDDRQALERLSAARERMRGGAMVGGGGLLASGGLMGGRRIMRSWRAPDTVGRRGGALGDRSGADDGAPRRHPPRATQRTRPTVEQQLDGLPDGCTDPLSRLRCGASRPTRNSNGSSSSSSSSSRQRRRQKRRRSGPSSSSSSSSGPAGQGTTTRPAACSRWTGPLPRPRRHS